MHDKQPSVDHQQIALQNESNNLTEPEPPIVIDCDNGGKVVINNPNHHIPNQLQTWTSSPKLSSDGSTLTFESDGKVDVVVSISKSNQIDYPSDEDHVEILYTDGPPENLSSVISKTCLKANKITALNKDYVTSAFSQLLAFHTASTDKPNQSFVRLINEAIATVSAVKCAANDPNAPPLTDLLTDKQASTLYCLNQALLNFASSGFEVKQFGALLLEAIVIASLPETGFVDDAEESNVQESSPLLPSAQPATTINRININNHGNGNKTIVGANGAVTDGPSKKDKDKEPSCLKRTWDYVCKPFIACSKCIPCCTCLTVACA